VLPTECALGALIYPLSFFYILLSNFRVDNWSTGLEYYPRNTAAYADYAVMPTVVSVFCVTNVRICVQTSSIDLSTPIIE
jgi:hypothetical protein